MKVNDVAVTGIGLTSSLGNNQYELWNNILAGRNGIKKLDTEYEYLNEYGAYIGATVSDMEFISIGSFSQQMIKRMNKLNIQTKMLIYAAYSAMQDAEIVSLTKNISTIIGCGVNYSGQYDNIDMSDRIPTWFFTTYPNVMLSQLFKILSLEGNGYTIVNACCSSMQAIGEAYRKIKSGEEKIMLAGGTDDKFNRLCTNGFNRLNMISNVKNPNLAMRPFDKKRDGFVMGQGSCILVLENLEHAKSRRAKIHGKISGYGSYMNVDSIADASFYGKQKAMEKALDDANITAKDVNYINAHGTSTVSNDMSESIAIKNVFGEDAYKIPISSTKSFLGHTFAACGALQSVICLRSLSEGILHKNRNYDSTDCLSLNFLKENLDCKNMVNCISNTSAIGGGNATLVFQKYII